MPLPIDVHIHLLVVKDKIDTKKSPKSIKSLRMHGYGMAEHFLIAFAIGAHTIQYEYDIVFW